MSRAKGTYATLENWALDLAPSLPGAAGWVLLALCRQSNYNRKTLKVAELMVAAHSGERTVQKALSYLVSEKLVQLTPEGYMVSKPGEQIDASLVSKRSQGLRKNLHPQNPENVLLVQEKPKGNPEIDFHKKKEEEGREGNKEKQQRGQTAARPAKTPTPFQEIFESLSLACYGGHDQLTAEAKSRVGRASKSLAAAGYVGGDVAQITGWIRQNETWRKGPLSPQTVAERAPAWRQGLTSASRPAAHQLDQQDWDAVAADSERERLEYLRLASGGGTNE